MMRAPCGSGSATLVDSLPFSLFCALFLFMNDRFLLGNFNILYFMAEISLLSILYCKYDLREDVLTTGSMFFNTRSSKNTCIIFVVC
jgi:regulatory protein YycH of two-component signal transduction system YycFG